MRGKVARRRWGVTYELGALPPVVTSFPCWSAKCFVPILHWVWLSRVELQNILNTFLVKPCGTVKEGKYRTLMFGVCSWLWEMPLGVVQGTETECLITALCVCGGAVGGND